MTTVSYLARGLVCLAVICTSTMLLGRTPIIPLSTNGVVGSWMGFSEGHVAFVRIELDANGTGFMAVSSTNDRTPSLYVVKKWAINGNDIEILLNDAEKGSDPIAIKNASWETTAMRVKYGGKDWERTALLFREDFFLARSREAKNGIEALRTGNKGK